MNKVYVNCGGSLYSFKSKREVMSFFESCIYGSEGSERERYTTIYFDVKNNLNTNKRCFTDGTSRVFSSDIKVNEVDDADKKLLQKNYKITRNDLLRFEAYNYLYDEGHNKIYNSKDLDTIEDIYDYYVKDNKSKNKTFYLFNEDKIICINDNGSDDNYYSEEFPIKDYKYADKWLKGEVIDNISLEDKKDYDDYEV